MAEVTLTINGKNYGISCDDGQERRVIDLGRHIDQRMKEISRAGAATNESHLMILTALMIADEAFELRETAGALDEQVRTVSAAAAQVDEEGIARAINALAERIDGIASRVSAA